MVPSCKEQDINTIYNLWIRAKALFYPSHCLVLNL